MPLSFSIAEKSITIHTNKTKKQTNTQSKLSIPHTTVWWDKNNNQLCHFSRTDCVAVVPDAILTVLHDVNALKHAKH